MLGVVFKKEEPVHEQLARQDPQIKTSEENPEVGTELVPEGVDNPDTPSQETLDDDIPVIPPESIEKINPDDKKSEKKSKKEKDQPQTLNEFFNNRKIKQKKRKAWFELLFEILIVLVILVVILNFIFGVSIMGGNGMSPAIKDGDAVLYYRLDTNYKIGEAVTYDFKEEKNNVGRIIASGGDTVEIKNTGEVLINGSFSTVEVDALTKPFEGANISYPITLKDDEVFILGDGREESADSRNFGAIKASSVKGKVITILRHRGI